MVKKAYLFILRIKALISRDDVWQINQTDLEILDHELLGRGAFAKVVKGRLKGVVFHHGFILKFRDDSLTRR